jgi:hypothetical protein
MYGILSEEAKVEFQKIIMSLFAPVIILCIDREDGFLYS